jgi:hypothetical protein
MIWMTFLTVWGLMILIAVIFFYMNAGFRKLVQDSEVTLISALRFLFAGSITLIAGIDPVDFQQQVREFVTQIGWADKWYWFMLGGAILLWIARWIRDKFFKNLTSLPVK